MCCVPHWRWRGSARARTCASTCRGSSYDEVGGKRQRAFPRQLDDHSNHGTARQSRILSEASMTRSFQKTHTHTEPRGGGRREVPSEQFRPTPPKCYTHLDSNLVVHQPVALKYKADMRLEFTANRHGRGEVAMSRGTISITQWSYHQLTGLIAGSTEMYSAAIEALSSPMVM